MYLYNEVLYQLSYSRNGASNQVRTDDLVLTKNVLYQLSYGSIT